MQELEFFKLKLVFHFDHENKIFTHFSSIRSCDLVSQHIILIRDRIWNLFNSYFQRWVIIILVYNFGESEIIKHKILYDNLYLNWKIQIPVWRPLTSDFNINLLDLIKHLEKNDFKILYAQYNIFCYILWTCLYAKIFPNSKNFYRNFINFLQFWNLK